MVLIWRCRLGRGSWSPRRSGKEEQNWSLKAEGCGCGKQKQTICQDDAHNAWSKVVVHSILLYFSTSPHIQSRVQSWLTMRPRCQSYRISTSWQPWVSSPPRWRERCCAERPAIAAAAVGRAYCPPTALNPAKQVLKWLQQGTSSVSAFWWTK